ncbi:MAG: hypothetical protein GC155_05520 [Alphaproteobacteria bacterium]|nr:hypothetical protein [Alphaproteobacteria bacterium]
MLKRKTVFVIGAGASQEFGLPVGSKLQQTIGSMLNYKFEARNRLSGDSVLWDAIERLNHKQELLAACWKVRDGITLSNSIDNFMDVHRSDPNVRTVGGLAIARAIIHAERKSTLFFDERNDQKDIDFLAVDSTWVLKLFRYLQEGVTVDNVGNIFSNASFIVFNYDRCLEHFMFRAVRAMYRIGSEQSAKVTETMRVIHPYGTIGRLPWQHLNLPDIPFGSDNPSLEEMAKGITTYTDGMSSTDTQALMHEWMMKAEQICFLGFSFQDQNVSLLSPPLGLAPPAGRHAEILGTCLGISPTDVRDIEGELVRKFRGCGDITLDRSMNCAQFIDSYSRRFH